MSTERLWDSRTHLFMTIQQNLPNANNLDTGRIFACFRRACDVVYVDPKTFGKRVVALIAIGGGIAALAASAPWWVGILGVCGILGGGLYLYTSFKRPHGEDEEGQRRVPLITDPEFLAGHRPLVVSTAQQVNE